MECTYMLESNPHYHTHTRLYHLDRIYILRIIILRLLIFFYLDKYIRFANWLQVGSTN